MKRLDPQCEHGLPMTKCPNCCPVRAEIEPDGNRGWRVTVLVGKELPLSTTTYFETRWFARRSARRQVAKERRRIVRRRVTETEVIR